MKPWPTWNDIKARYPNFAQQLLVEYKNCNGFIPYEQGYVYLVHAIGSDFYKIGKSVNPDRRLLQIAPQMPFETRFVKIWRTSFMSRAEKSLHKRFASRRANGEWFSLDSYDLWHLLDEMSAWSIAYIYSSVIKELLYSNKEEWKRFYEEFSEIFAPYLSAEISLAVVQKLFREISSELDAHLPPDIKEAVIEIEKLQCGDMAEVDIWG